MSGKIHTVAHEHGSDAHRLASYLLSHFVAYNVFAYTCSVQSRLLIDCMHACTASSA